MKEHALAYANRGWPVFPLKPGRKDPLTTNGFKDATIDADQIDRWWSRTPNANIGCATGAAFCVLDVDGPEGNAHLKPVADGYHHNGPVSYTGKGWHYLFAPSDHKTVHGRAEPPRFVPKVDFQSVGAYIVLPPSVHPNGQIYHWDVKRGPDLLLPPLPDWLVDILEPVTQPPRDTRMRCRMNLDGTLTPIRNMYEANRPPILQVAADLGLTGRYLGSNKYMVHCIFHDDSTASLCLFLDENRFWCFGCDVGGDSHQLARRKIGYRK
jgi:hypothetical protein